MADSNFWDEPSLAQRTIKEANILREEVESWDEFSRRIQDANELAQLDDESLRAELEVEVEGVPGLGGDVAAYVFALGRNAWL